MRETVSNLGDTIGDGETSYGIMVEVLEREQIERMLELEQ